MEKNHKLTIDEVLQQANSLTVVIPLIEYALQGYEGTQDELLEELQEKDVVLAINDMYDFVKLSRGWQDIEESMIDKLDISDKEDEKPAKKKRSAK